MERWYMPPYHQHLILAFLYPLRDYLTKVSYCRLSPDYPAAFEWICVKRFQELFGDNSRGCPHVVLPDFFTKQQLFGLCAEVKFAKHARPMPKITEKGDLQPWLDTQTASPEKWLFMMTDIDRVLAEVGRLTLKPRPKSASSDALLVTKIDKKKLTVGLAVENPAGGTSFGETKLKVELDVFNRMFVASESDDRLNILIVCSTSYSASLKTKCEATDSEGQKKIRNSAVYSTVGFPNIHEVILLNLSTPEQRGKFFGMQNEELQKMERVIKKAQVEVHSKK